jgi:hypothetical protein
MIINGVPQYRRSGLLIINGVPEEDVIDDVELINGVRQLSPNGIEIINGVPQTGAVAAIPNPGWIETDPNTLISVDNASLLTANWTLSGNPLYGSSDDGNYASIVADAGSAFWTGDFTMNVRIKTNAQGSPNWLIQNNFGLYSELIKAGSFPGVTFDGITANVYEVGGTNVSGGVTSFRNGSSTNGSFLGLNTELDNYNYWTLARSGTTFSLEGWIASDRSGGADWSSSGTIQDSVVEPLRYIYLFNMWVPAGALNGDFEIQLESIDPSPW